MRLGGGDVRSVPPDVREIAFSPGSCFDGPHH